jgi:hypothetical protein
MCHPDRSAAEWRNLLFVWSAHAMRCYVANFRDRTVELSNKNKVQKVGMFFRPEKCPSTHHVLPATHHNFTIKKPRKKHTFSQNPLQKRTSTTQKK